MESQPEEPSTDRGETPPSQAQQSDSPHDSTWRAKPKTRCRPQGLNPDLSEVGETDLDILILMAKKEKKQKMLEAAEFESSQDDEADENM